MICSNFCVFLNKFGHCDIALRPPARIAVCPHTVIRRSPSLAASGGSSGGLPHAEKAN